MSSTVNLKPYPEAPTYDTSSWDDSEKGKQALDDYNKSKNAVINFKDFKYGKQGQYDNIMDKILNREKFSYDLNEDAFYQQYKDKFVNQGKMAMADTMGQAAALTGGYGNSYAQSVGQQAYHTQLDKLNDVVPELYQMAYDRYNQEGQDLYNQYGILSDDYDRQYGKHNDEYGKAVDAYNINSDAYYKGGDMFYTDQNNTNAALGNQFDDAMAIANAENANAWKQAEFDAAYGDTDTTDDTPKPTYTDILNKVKAFMDDGESISMISDYLRSAWKAGYITDAEYNSLEATYVPRTNASGTGTGGHYTY